MSAKLAALAALIAALHASGASADTLANVKARGNIVCGVIADTPGFSAPAADGGRSGLGPDFCRSLAAVIFNDSSKVAFAAVQATDEVAALTSGRVDVLADVMPWTLDADADRGLRFVGTMFFDGQGFIVPKVANMKSARDLAGKPVCVEAGDTQVDAAEYFDANNITATLLPMESRQAAVAAYTNGSCVAYSADLSILAGVRAGLAVPGDHVLLPDLITKRPRGNVIGQGDDHWFDVARWTFFALLDAEELGVTQGNVDEMLGSDNISIRRFLGVEGDFGAVLGLNKDWAYQLVKSVGNYADLYDRNVGESSALKLPRGLNALWNKGGIQYAPPVQ